MYELFDQRSHQIADGEAIEQGIQPETFVKLLEAMKGHYSEPILFRYTFHGSDERHVSFGTMQGIPTVTTDGFRTAISVENSGYTTLVDNKRVNVRSESAQINLDARSLNGVGVNAEDPNATSFDVGLEQVIKFVRGLPEDQIRFIGRSLKIAPKKLKPENF